MTHARIFAQVLVKDPAKLNVARFQKISSFLEVVVGLLLGFFLSSSMQRPGTRHDHVMFVSAELLLSFLRRKEEA